MALFALVDCNSFYCSCQRVFDPKLANVPVIVLSNNDGCIIARTSEAKALGIKMAEPYFKARDIIQKNRVRVFSSNYALYADMSARAVAVLGQFSPEIEVYSIDECFLDLEGFEHLDLIEYGQEIRARMLQWTALPVCVGIGPTKTLAKLANHFAKDDKTLNGVCDIRAFTSAQLDERLARSSVNEVWGIGRRLTEKLNALGIRSVLDLRNANARDLSRRFSVVVERTVTELCGESCLDLEEVAPTRKQIICSRSFGHRVESLDDLIEAVNTYTTRAAEKLRAGGSTSAAVAVFAHTSLFQPNQPTYSAGLTVPLVERTDDTRRLVQAAQRGLRAIYRPGYRYAKAGVMLLDLGAKGLKQGSLWEIEADPTKAAGLMETLDKVNRRMGSGTLTFAGGGVKKPWQMQRQAVSPCFTTRWDELPEAKAR